MRYFHFKFVLFSIFFLTMLSACTNPDAPASNAPTPPAPAAFSSGEKLFNSNCAGCHGMGAKGSDRGPTFISKIYEPSHHGDGAFHMAVQKGVRAHHWNFGNMPKISGVSKEEVDEIIGYIRWIQRENGIS